MAIASPVRSEIFMWRLNCPDSEVLMIEKRSLAMRKVSGSVSNDVPSTLLSHSAICAHWAPTHVSMRLVGKSGLCGPNSTVSIMKLLQKKATSPMTPPSPLAPDAGAGRRCARKKSSPSTPDPFFSCSFVCRRGTGVITRSFRSRICLRVCCLRPYSLC